MTLHGKALPQHAIGPELPVFPGNPPPGIPGNQPLPVLPGNKTVPLINQKPLPNLNTKQRPRLNRGRIPEPDTATVAFEPEGPLLNLFRRRKRGLGSRGNFG